MKNLVLFAFLATAFLMTSCDNDDDGTQMHTDFDYHVHINAPTDASTTHIGATLNVDISFESHTGETVHNISVQIKKKEDDTVVFSHEEHAHAESGMHNYVADIMMDADNNMEPHTDYVLEAKVWGHEAGVQEASATAEFHVHPQ